MPGRSRSSARCVSSRSRPRRCRLLFGRAIARQQLHPEPLIILGHPRTGTTHLHNLLSLDPRFAYLSTFQAGGRRRQAWQPRLQPVAAPAWLQALLARLQAQEEPDHALRAGRAGPQEPGAPPDGSRLPSPAGFPSSFIAMTPFKGLLSPLLDSTRPMDNMALTWQLPAEDEIATCTLTGGAGREGLIGPGLGQRCSLLGVEWSAGCWLKQGVLTGGCCPPAGCISPYMAIVLPKQYRSVCPAALPLLHH